MIVLHRIRVLLTPGIIALGNTIDAFNCRCISSCIYLRIYLSLFLIVWYFKTDNIRIANLSFLIRSYNPRDSLYPRLYWIRYLLAPLWAQGLSHRNCCSTVRSFLSFFFFFSFLRTSPNNALKVGHEREEVYSISQNRIFEVRPMRSPPRALARSLGETLKIVQSCWRLSNSPFPLSAVFPRTLDTGGIMLVRYLLRPVARTFRCKATLSSARLLSIISVKSKLSIIDPSASLSVIYVVIARFIFQSFQALPIFVELITWYLTYYNSQRIIHCI